MTSSNLCRALALGLFLLIVPGAAAQVTDSQPIKIEAPKPKTEKFKGEVLLVTRVAITVRDRENKNLVRTFNYEDKLAEKIKKHFDENKPYSTATASPSSTRPARTRRSRSKASAASTGSSADLYLYLP